MADKAENENTGGQAGSERRAALRSDAPGGGSTRLRETGFPMRKASTLPDVSAYSGSVGSGMREATSNEPNPELAAAEPATVSPSTAATQQIAATPAGEKEAGDPHAGITDHFTQTADDDGAPSQASELAEASSTEATDDGAPRDSKAYSRSAGDSDTDAHIPTRSDAGTPSNSGADAYSANGSSTGAGNDAGTSNRSGAPETDNVIDSSIPSGSGTDQHAANGSGSGTGTPNDSGAPETDNVNDEGDHTTRLQTTPVPVSEPGSGFGSTAVRSARNAGGTRSAGTRDAGDRAFDDDAAPDTSALTIRPSEEEVNRRASQRDEAAAAKPLLPRVMQVVVAVLFPVILLGAAVRAVTTPLFLWAEYHRPGFPADSYGFSTEDRMTYGSYAMDYILNWAPARYLGDLVNPDGDQLFLDSEVGHMADVKAVLSTGFVVATVLAILAIAACVYLARRYPGGVRRALFAGAVATLVLAVALAVVGVLAWETFFTQVHAIFFADGTWTFRLDDTLIRLFPAQFWIDAAAVVGAIVLLGSVLTLVLTWPTKVRREKSANAYARRRAASGV